MEIDEVRALAEQKNKKKTAKTTAKSPSVKKATARSSAGRETANGSEKRNHQNDGAACPFWGQYSR